MCLYVHIYANEITKTAIKLVGRIAVAVKVVEMAVFVVSVADATGICVGSCVRHEFLLGIAKDLLLFGLHHV